jgi:hypothetical protein
MLQLLFATKLERSDELVGAMADFICKQVERSSAAVKGSLKHLTKAIGFCWCRGEKLKVQG